MILPAKHIPLERSLSGIGADILRALDTPQSVSETWLRVHTLHDPNGKPVTFDWFILSLSWLYAISAIELKDGMLIRGSSS